MAKFQINIGDTSGKTYRVDIEEDSQTRPLIGMSLGNEINGDVIGFDGYKLKITGGSDTDGFPMNPSVVGGMRKKILSSGGVGYNPKQKGIRKRKSIRGNIITEDIYQLNMKITQTGSKSIEEVLADLKTE